MLGTQSALQKVHLWQKVDVGGNVYAAEVRANVPNAGNVRLWIAAPVAAGIPP